MRKMKSLVMLVSLMAIHYACQKPDQGLKPITPQEIEAHTRFISDDLLEGRGTGSRGLDIAALYQENYFRSLGLQPGFGESFRQPFWLKGSQPDKNAKLEIFSDGTKAGLRVSDDFVLSSYREEGPETVEGELIYCGYLIQAPERNWDDIKGADLRGKVLLVEVNEPGNYPGGIFDGVDMTYYGRWTYKFEKAAELGAAGIFIIFNAKGASYGWEIVKNGWSRERFFLPDKENQMSFQGWIKGDVIDKIFESAHLNYAELATGAEKQEFKPVPTGLMARVKNKPSFRPVPAENVAALLRGKHKEHTDRYVILTAHHDHLGQDLNKEGDQIYNGALENGTGTATLLALARYYAQFPEDLKINLLFLAPTAEEEGLLGSEYFARRLPFPASTILANLNFQMTNVWGETEDVYAIGGNQSDLDDFCRRAAENRGLRYIPERSGNLGYFFRSDQLSFARVGIPAVWLHEGVTSKGQDKDYVLKKDEEYRRYKYHQVTDEVEENWDFKGAVQLAEWTQEIISLLSEAKDLPQFNSLSSFRRKNP